VSFFVKVCFSAALREEIPPNRKALKLDDLPPVNADETDQKLWKTRGFFTDF
jgi:hypothetical protein